MSEVSKMEIFSLYTHTGCCFPASTPGTDKLLLSMVAIPVDPLLYFSCSIVRKPGGIRVLRSANREKPLLGWQPVCVLRHFLSTYVYYIIHGTSDSLCLPQVTECCATLFWKDVGMDEALYIYLHFYILPCLCTFWHAIPTSFFIFNDFSVLYTLVNSEWPNVQNSEI